jgi:tRNA modification GTPase
MARTSSRTSSADAETIVAVSSPAGASLRAVVRLSGPRALEVAAGVPGAVAFRGPRTYTREDVVEIHLPGSPPLVERLVRELAGRGARPARPGEFTLRAFLNGRVDLARAEAVERLIAAEDQEERRAALGLLGGGFSRRLGRIEGALLDLSADAEAALDFADQDIDLLPVEKALERARSVRAHLEALVAETAASAVSDGRPVVALFGPPGAGKSSLFNRLTGGDALVADRAGTTRDVLSAEIDIGVRLKLLDTAGQHEAGGLEGEAVRRSAGAARAADLLVLVVDAADWEKAIPLEPRGLPALLVANKCDLARPEDLRRRFHIREVLFTSARTGEGIAELKAALARRLGGEGTGGAGARFRANSRQHALLGDAGAALDRALAAAPGLGMEFVAMDLRAALEALGGITGRSVGEELLDRIFSRFCLGK